MIDGSMDEKLNVGIVISARSDGRLLRATLESIERLADAPGLVVVAIPQGREHLLDRPELARSPVPVRMVVTNGPADSWLTLGFRSLAPVVDIAIFVSEGILLKRDFLRRAQDSFADWEDLVGKLEVVADVFKITPGSGSAGLAVESEMRDGLLPLLVRRWLRARSLMPSVLSLRIAACGNLKFVTFSAFCDWMSFALFLDRLRPRGRTVVAIAEDAQELRFTAERRSGFEFGYELYDRLSRIGDYVDDLSRASYLNPKAEKMRLFAEQALQYLLAPRTKRHIVTVMKGMLAARRDIRMQARRIRAEIRDLV